MANTYCKELWENITIDKNGDVFVCCHCKPQKIGNIHEGKLEQLVNCDKLISLRQQSLDGTLGCYRECNLLDSEKRPPCDLALKIDYSDLKVLHISFGEKCNIRCIMCDHPSGHNRNPIELDHTALIENIDVSPFKEIIIQGGEPLCIQSCLDYMDFLEMMNKKYILLTNGLLINRSMSEKLAKNASIISISINGATKAVHENVNRGSDFDKVMHNISKLVEAREKFNTNMSINGRMTLVTQNLHEIPLFIKKFEEMGFDTINFGYDLSSVPSYLEENKSFFENLRDSIKNAINKSNCERIDMKRLRQLQLIGA